MTIVILPTAGFNSRTPGGVRQKQGFRFHTILRVSIHAPREGCDFHIDVTRSPFICFNSRTPGGVRRFNPFRLLAYQSFNSRTPGGVRLPLLLLLFSLLLRFNSRTPGGVRPGALVQ